VRRTQPRHAAAFLVDQNRCFVASDAAAKRADQIANLRGRVAIAPEQYEADWIDFGEEVPLEGSKTLAAAAQYNCERHLIGQ